MDNEVEMDENTNEDATKEVNQIDLDENKDLQITYYALVNINISLLIFYDNKLD